MKPSEMEHNHLFTMEPTCDTACQHGGRRRQNAMPHEAHCIRNASK